MPDDDDDDLTPEEEERFAKLLARERAREKDEADRRKPPKDFGDAMDRIAHRVVDILEERADTRRKERDAADEPPDRNAKSGNFLSWLGGGDT